jgi:chromate transport protein ChrA
VFAITSTIPQEKGIPQAPTQSHSSPARSRREAALVLGLIGGLLGVVDGAAFLLILIRWKLLHPYGYTYLVEGWFTGLATIIFSVFAIVGSARILDRGDNVNGWLMIVSAAVVLLCANWWGLPSSLLIFLGGVLLLLKKG